MHQCMNYGHIMIERKVCLYKLWRPHSIIMIVTCNIHTYYMSCVLRNTNTLRLKCRGQNAYHVHVLLSMRNCKLMVSSFSTQWSLYYCRQLTITNDVLSLSINITEEESRACSIEDLNELRKSVQAASRSSGGLSNGRTIPGSYRLPIHSPTFTVEARNL